MNDFQVKIPKPCPENWNNMIPDKNGRYCHSCNKVVVDFTVMTTDEIKNYFKQVSGTGTCGRFTYDQVQVERTKKEVFFKSLYDKLQGIKLYPVRYVSVLMLGFVMMMFGCDLGGTTGEKELTDDTTISSQSIEHIQPSSTDKQIVIFLKEFYTNYINENSKMPRNEKNIDKIKRKYCTNNLINKINNEELDFDPFLNAQDCQEEFLKTLSINKGAGEFDTYVVSYMDDYSKTKITIELTVVIEKDGFKIDSILP
jgi:hypothetical protein